MRCRYRFWGTVLTISTVLAGCGSPAPHRRPEGAAQGTAPAVEISSVRLTEEVVRSHAHYASGVIHEMNGETEAALQEYFQAALGDPGNSGLVLEVSRRLLQNKQAEKALELLKTAAAQPDPAGEILARLGLVYSQLGKYEQAATADRAAIKRAPASLVGYQNLFLNCLHRKQETEAVKVLDEAARQPDTDAEFLLGLVGLYAEFVLQAPTRKDAIHPKALAILNRAEQLKPTDPMLRLRLADGYNLLGEPSKAAPIYLDLLKRLPDLPMLRERLHTVLAGIYLRGSDHKRAVEQLEAILRDDPTNPQVCFFLGRLAYEDNKPEAAADYFSKALLLNPRFEPAYYELALAQISLNQTGQALATLENARKTFPPNFALEFWTGLAYSRAKAYRQAVERFNAAEVMAKAGDATTLTPSFYFQFGAACERAGDIAEAEKHFEKCLQLAPDDAEAMNYLGYMWAEQGIKLERARTLLEKAVKAQPKNSAFLDSLGWALFKLNRPAEALTYLLKAIELTETPDPALYDHLGDIYAALGQPEEAREAWTKSLSIEANDTVRKKLEPAAAR